MTQWITVYYYEGDLKKVVTAEDVADGVAPDPAPARAFLAGLPKSPRAGLRATIVAVRDRPPPSFPASTPVWRLMHKPHKKGDVDMSGIFEARDKHQQKLYRLFCVLDSKGPEHGLAAPAVVLLSGTIKNVGEVVPQSVYKAVRAQADHYFATSPRPAILDPGVQMFAPMPIIPAEPSHLCYGSARLGENTSRGG